LKLTPHASNTQVSTVNVPTRELQGEEYVGPIACVDRFVNVQRRTVRFSFPTMPKFAVPLVVIVQSSKSVPPRPSLTWTAMPGEAPRSVIPLTETLLAVTRTAGDAPLAVMEGVSPFMDLIRRALLIVTGSKLAVLFTLIVSPLDAAPMAPLMACMVQAIQRKARALRGLDRTERRD